MVSNRRPFTREANVITTTLRKGDSRCHWALYPGKPKVQQPLSKTTFNIHSETLEPQALSGTETAAPEGPALGFLISPEVRPLGPPQTAFGVSHPTQSPQTLSCAPEQRSPPPTPQLPEAAGGEGWVRSPGDLAALSVDSTLPGLRNSMALFTAPAVSALGSQEWPTLPIPSEPHPAPRCSFAPDSCALSLQPLSGVLLAKGSLFGVL